MSVPTRRAVRLTVLTPSSDVDLEVADDATGAEIVREVLTDPAVLALDAPLGWELTHPVHGPIPPDSGPGDVHDGDVLLLTVRESSKVGTPVDDVAERTREVIGEAGENLAATVAGVCTVVVAPAAALVLAHAGQEVRPTAVVGLLAAFVVPWVLRERRQASASASLMAIPAVATSAALLASGLPLAATTGVAMLGLWAASISNLLVTGDHRWWPWSAGSGCAAVLVGIQAIGTFVTREHASAVTTVAVAVVMAVSVPASLSVSGLGRLDDLVAAGEEVSVAAVDVAVGRAGDILTGILVATAVTNAVVAGALADRGASGAALAVVVSLLVAARARTLLRVTHVVPVATGGALGVMHVLVVAVGADNARAVLVLVGAMIVGAAVVATSFGDGVSPVTAGRVRYGAEIAEKLLVIAIPLLLVAEFDLYRSVWERF